jgi:hypothetical protein
MGSKIGPPILNCQIQGQRKNVVTNLFIYYILVYLMIYMICLLIKYFCRINPRSFFFVKWGWLGAE